MKKQSNQQIVTSLICVLMLLAVALGCKRLSQRNYNGSSRRGSNTNSGGKVTDGLTEKSNLYIKDCVNKYSSSVMNSYRRYASWLKDVEQGPTGKESIVYGLYEINSD